MIMVYADMRMCQDLAAIGYGGDWHKVLVYVEGGSFHPLDGVSYRKEGTVTFPRPCMEEIVEWLEDVHGFVLQFHRWTCTGGAVRWSGSGSCMHGGGGGPCFGTVNDSRQNAVEDMVRMCIDILLDRLDGPVVYIDVEMEK